MRNDISTTNNDENQQKVQIHNAPGHELRSFFNHVWNMIDFPHHGEISDMEPKIEIMNNKEEVVVSAEMPGIKENDIDLQISSDGYLTISGERRQKNEDTGNGSYFSEIYYGKVSRIVPLPWDLNYDKADAEFSDGILKVSIPKTQVEKQKVKKISVKKSK